MTPAQTAEIRNCAERMARRNAAVVARQAVGFRVSALAVPLLVSDLQQAPQYLLLLLEELADTRQALRDAQALLTESA